MPVSEWQWCFIIVPPADAVSACVPAEFINPKDLPEGQSIVDKLIEMTDGGCDFTYDATGNVHVMRQALEACHKGWGVSTIIGVAPAGAEISTRPYVMTLALVALDFRLYPTHE